MATQKATHRAARENSASLLSTNAVMQASATAQHEWAAITDGGVATGGAECFAVVPLDPSAGRITLNSG
jgi:hypothetical protein